MKGAMDGSMADFESHLPLFCNLVGCFCAANCIRPCQDLNIRTWIAGVEDWTIYPGTKYKRLARISSYLPGSYCPITCVFFIEIITEIKEKHHINGHRNSTINSQCHLNLYIEEWRACVTEKVDAARRVGLIQKAAAVAERQWVAREPLGQSSSRIVETTMSRTVPNSSE